MSTDVRVPTTGNAGEDAVLVEWQVAVGDEVQADAVIAVLETAKTTMDLVAPVAGTIVSLHAQPGDEVAEFAVIARIGSAGEAPVPAAASNPRDERKPGSERKPGDEEPRSTEPIAPVSLEPSTQRARIAGGSGARISPRARVLANRHGIDPSDIPGSGPHGRVLIDDVKRFVQSTGEPKPLTPSVGTSQPARQPLRGARKVTAQRMAAAVDEVAPVTLQRMAAADVLVGLAARLKDATQPRIGINELVMFAVASVLPRHQQANAHFSWEGISQFPDVHLGFAVDNGRALLVPVIADANKRSLRSFAAESRRLTDLAIGDRLTPEDMVGATFTVTNLGAFGVEWFNPIVNPPQVCILGVGAVQQRDGTPHLPLSLTFDHRALDGAAAARCLADIATAISTIDVVAALSDPEGYSHAQ